MQKRIDFAKDFLKKPADFWKHVIWSDETMIRSRPKNNEVHVKTNRKDWRDHFPSNPQVQNGGFGVMFWGCFSSLGLGPLVALDENLKSAEYIKLLKEHLIPEMEAAGIPMIFMQDNAPCHKSAAVTQFLAQENVTTLPWPAQSPDLNPIENLWAIIKARLKGNLLPPTNRNQLIENVFAVWSDISAEIKDNLCDSMINRLNEVLLKKGRAINY